VSVRRFSSFGLFTRSEAPEASSPWTEFSCPSPFDDVHASVSVFVKLVDSPAHVVDPHALSGFNNTGNVCIWPSEEVLAYYVFKNKHLFARKSVLELGGGMTCFAGLVAAKCCDPSRVLLTDGNDTSVNNVRQIVAHNFPFPPVPGVSNIRWDVEDSWKAHENSFDVVLCSDCLFFEDGRGELVRCISEVLNEGGVGYVAAPRRGRTLDAFVSAAESVFQVNVLEDYDGEVTKKRREFENRGDFDPDIHFPLLIVLKKRFE
jgi:calmodulin-lysine N-methyltransferase